MKIRDGAVTDQTEEDICKFIFNIKTILPTNESAGR
jgi:hypothetical protein